MTYYKTIDLKKQYGSRSQYHRALDGSVDLSVDRGSSWPWWATSGNGKVHLLNIMGDWTPPTSWASVIVRGDEPGRKKKNDEELTITSAAGTRLFSQKL